MLGWALRQLETLERDQAAFLRKQPYALLGKYEVVDGERFAVVSISVAEFLRPVDDLVFRVGDVLHNLRVSLDYLAFAIARKHFPAATDKANRQVLFQVSFPICGNFENWPALKKKMLLERWASAEAIRHIEVCQPFSRPDNANLDPLFLLHQLDNPHKHRNLLAAAPAISGIDFTATDPRYTPVSFGLGGRPFRDGAEVARYKFVGAANDPLPHPDAKVVTEVGFEIAFDEQGPAMGLPALPMLREMAVLIQNVIGLLERHT